MHAGSVSARCFRAQQKSPVRARDRFSQLRTTTAVWAAAAVLTVGGMEIAAAVDQPRPNILFIMSDDHGYQAMSCYGSRVNQTPNLDRLAKQGMRFDRCFVTNSICGPCRAVILTGKYSHLNGFARNGQTFNGNQPHVAKMLRRAGYQTAVIGKWHLRTEPTGFDYYHRLIGQGPYYNPKMRTNQGQTGPRGYRDVQHQGYTTDIITDLALKWLKEGRNKERPFYLMYQHKAPHRNWQPAPRHLNTYDDVTIAEPPTLFDDYRGRGTAAQKQEMTIARHLTPHDLKLSRQRGFFTPQQRMVWDRAYGPKNEALAAAKLEGEDLVRWKYQRYVKDYLRCVDAVDENVGRVLDYLDESGLAENTLVIYTSDQGWYLGEHGWYDKRWMYEESFRTPLLMRWPGRTPPGSVSTQLTMNLDFAETFLDIAGAEIPDAMQGQSLLPLLSGKQPDNWRSSIYYHYYEHPGPHMVHRHYGVRTDRFKLIYFYQLDEWELYDLTKDPHELMSVYDAPAYRATVESLKRELKRLRQHYRDDGSVVDFGAQRARNVKQELAARFDFGDLGDTRLHSGTLVPGRQATAVELDGSQPALRRPSDANLDPTYKPFTVGGWFKPSNGNGVLLALGGRSLGYALYLNQGQIEFAIRRGGLLKTLSGPPISLDKWQHVTATVDPDGKASIRLNGQPGGEPTMMGFIGARPADGLSIGADSGSLVGRYSEANGFKGQLEDIRIYWGPVTPAVLDSWSKP